MAQDLPLPVPGPAAQAPAGPDGRRVTGPGESEGGIGDRAGDVAAGGVCGTAGTGPHGAPVGAATGGGRGRDRTDGPQTVREEGLAREVRHARARATRARAWTGPGRHRTPLARPCEAEVARLTAEFRARGGAVTLCPPACVLPIRNGDGLAPPETRRSAASEFLSWD